MKFRIQRPMKISVKIEVPDNKNCLQCYYFHSISFCQIFGDYIENDLPCPKCIRARKIAKEKEKGE